MCCSIFLSLVCRVFMVLTAGSLAQHLDASLWAALSFLQFTLVGVSRRIWATNRSDQGRTLHSFANTLCLGRVCWVTLTHSTKATQHPSAACKKKSEGEERLGSMWKHTSRRQLKLLLEFQSKSMIPKSDFFIPQEKFPKNECKENIYLTTWQACLNRFISICASHQGPGAELHTVEKHKCTRD